MFIAVPSNRKHIPLKSIFRIPLTTNLFWPATRRHFIPRISTWKKPVCFKFEKLYFHKQFAMLDNQLLCLEICLVCLDQIMTTYCRESERHQSQDGSCMPRNTVGNQQLIMRLSSPWWRESIASFRRWPRNDFYDIHM